MDDRAPERAVEPLPSPIADAHCHLGIDRDDERRLALTDPRVRSAIAAAADVGVTRIVEVGVDLASSQWAVDLATAIPEVWAAVAVHPNEAPKLHEAGGLQALESAWASIGALAERPEVRAIGETGMDKFRTEARGLAAQEESFRAHVEIAKRTGKALMVHDREAHDDVIRILDDEGSPDVVVLHCFSGGVDFARAAAERGWFCSFAGVVTFRNAGEVRDAAAVVPGELLLAETDAPFLAPTPYRGQANSPALLPLTVRALAELRDEPLDQLCAQLWDNAERAFGAL